MFSHILASLALAFSLLPQTVQPLNSGQTETVTRAEAATALLLARNPNVAVIKNTGQFADIRRGDWFEPYMLAAERVGILKANADKQLRPNDAVNRAEFLKMLTLTFTIPTGYSHVFLDVSKNAWYSEYAGIVRSFKLPLQDNAQYFGADKKITHAQALQSIQTFVRLYNPSAKTILDEQQIAIDQSQNKLVLYDLISTRKTKVVFSSDSPALKPSAPVTPQPSLPELRTQIVMLVNTERLKAGLKPLIYSTQLEESAQRYAEQMANKGFFGHVSPSGETVKDRIAATGYYAHSFSEDCNCIKGFSLGENLGRGQTTADEVMADWMQSKTHRAAILSPDYSDIGVGVFSGIWVEHFGGVLLPGQKIAGSK